MKLNIYEWIIIGFLGLILVFIVWNHFYSKNTPHYENQCPTDSDCSDGDKCIFSKDLNRKICVDSGQMECLLSPATELQECDLNDKQSCAKCTNLPEFGCVQVTYGTATISEPGNGYKDSSSSFTTAKTGTGNGMIISYNTKNKMIIEPIHIVSPGNGYKIGDILNVSAASPPVVVATITITQQPKPYTWKQGKDITLIPESNKGKGWCLPPVTDSNTCNLFTSDNVLIKNDDGTYKWGCHCTTQDLFDQKGPYEPCNVVKACGQDKSPPQGDLWVLKHADGPEDYKCNSDADCTTKGLKNSKCCPPDNGSGQCSDPAPAGEDKHCYVRWETQEDTDPRYGRCECIDGLSYFGSNYSTDSYNKLCVTDSCQPNGKKDTTSCTCNTGYIRCPEDVKQELKSSCISPTCLLDPCAPLGTYDKINKTCRCNGTASSVPNSASPVGFSCVDLCNPSPCGGRGTCSVTGSDPNKKVSCSCLCPWCNPGDQNCVPISDKNPANVYCNSNNGKLLRGSDCNDKSQCCSNYCPSEGFLGRRHCKNR